MKVSKDEEFKLASKQILYAMSLKLDPKSIENLEKNVILTAPRDCYKKMHDEEVVQHFGNLLLGSFNQREASPQKT